MRRTVLILLFSLPTLAWGASKPPEGRWEGPVRIPGRDLQVVVDLAQDSAGAWTGSIIVPGLGIKGEPLTKLVVTGKDVVFEVGSSLGSATYGAAAFKAHLTSAEGMAGEMKQGGNVAKFALRRVAQAQVESAPRSTRVAREVEDPANSNSVAIRATSRSPSKITPMLRQRPSSSSSASRPPICRSIS
jgi:hypothetical protein